MEKPKSILTKCQKKIVTKYYKEGGKKYRMDILLRYDDGCGNGHNTFSITADIFEKKERGRPRFLCGGCCHDEIAKYAPEFAHLIKWHLCSSEEPLHYLANTLYFASDKDYNGHRKGEPDDWAYGIRFNNVPIIHQLEKPFYDFIQNRYSAGEFGITYIEHEPDERQNWKPKWTLEGYGKKWYECPFRSKEEARQFCEALNTCKVVFDKMVTGHSAGKERELDAARRTAIWPEATDEQLTSPNLAQLLIDRLPALLDEFKKDMESLGFVY